MIRLSAESIKEFQEAYKKDFGKEITPEEAEELGRSLITLLSVIYKPMR